VTTVLLLLFLGLAMAQLWGPPPDDVTLHGITLGPFPLSIHHLAAILLIAALAIAVWCHAWPGPVTSAEGGGTPQTGPKTKSAYRVIFILMLLGPIVSAGFYWLVTREHTVIFLEWWEILLFCLFWILETQRIRKLPSGAGVAPTTITATARQHS
jgi:hypothetical protein